MLTQKSKNSIHILIDFFINKRDRSHTKYSKFEFAVLKFLAPHLPEDYFLWALEIICHVDLTYLREQADIFMVLAPQLPPSFMPAALESLRHHQNHYYTSAQTWNALLSNLPPSLLETALQQASEIENDMIRASILKVFGSYVPESLAMSAISAATAIKEPGARIYAQAAFSQYLSECDSFLLGASSN